MTTRKAKTKRKPGRPPRVRQPAYFPGETRTRCPRCQATDTRVDHTVTQASGHIRRTRVCAKCHCMFPTWQPPAMVAKQEGAG